MDNISDFRHLTNIAPGSRRFVVDLFPLLSALGVLYYCIYALNSSDKLN